MVFWCPPSKGHVESGLNRVGLETGPPPPAPTWLGGLKRVGLETGWPTTTSTHVAGCTVQQLRGLDNTETAAVPHAADSTVTDRMNLVKALLPLQK